MFKKIGQILAMMSISLFIMACQTLVKPLPNITQVSPKTANDKLVFIIEQKNNKQKISKLVMTDTQGKHAKILSQIQGMIYSLSASQDGRTLIYTQQTGKTFPVIYQFDIATGEKQLQTPQRTNHYGASLSPDNQKMLISHSGNGNPDIYLQHLDKPITEPLINNSHADIAPVWLPNQQGFLFTSDRENEAPQLYRYMFSDKSVKKVSLQGKSNLTARISPDSRWVSFVNDKGQGVIAPLTVLGDIGETWQITHQEGLYEPANFSKDSQFLLYSVKDKIIIQNIQQQNKRTMIELKNIIATTGEQIGEGVIREPVWIGINE